MTSDAEIIERYLLYMRYAVMSMENKNWADVSVTLHQLIALEIANPHITFPRVKLALTVVDY